MYDQHPREAGVTNSPSLDRRLLWGGCQRNSTAVESFRLVRSRSCFFSISFILLLLLLFVYYDHYYLSVFFGLHFCVCFGELFCVCFFGGTILLYFILEGDKVLECEELAPCV